MAQKQQLMLSFKVVAIHSKYINSTLDRIVEFLREKVLCHLFSDFTELQLTTLRFSMYDHSFLFGFMVPKHVKVLCLHTERNGACLNITNQITYSELSHCHNSTFQNFFKNYFLFLMAEDYKKINKLGALSFHFDYFKIT